VWFAVVWALCFKLVTGCTITVFGCCEVGSIAVYSQYHVASIMMTTNGGLRMYGAMVEQLGDCLHSVLHAMSLMVTMVPRAMSNMFLMACPYSPLVCIWCRWHQGMG